MSKENKINKKENDSNDAPPATPGFNNINNINNEYLTICPECSSSIEILSINEQNNVIEFRCIKNNKNYIMTIKEYLEKIKEYKEKNINNLKDTCQIHNDNKYVSYCFECNCHLCDECLKTRIHINHKKSNIIEISPIKEEINIIKEVIKDYEMRLENKKNEKTTKTKEINDKLNNENNIEKYKLEKIININKEKEKEELEINNDISDIEEIKRKYENEIRIRRKKYIEEKKNINNKYKFINEEENIKYKLKIEKIKKIYTNKIKSYKFEEKIGNFDNMLRINETIFNVYKTYNNNYYNAVNINNLLLYYIKNDYINNKIMKNILKDNYDKIINIIKQKNNEDNKLILKTKNENDKNNKIEEKYKNEINILKKKISQIYII